MATTPVRIVSWFEPPLAVDVPMGASIRCRAAVLDIDSGLPVAPDTLLFHVQPPYTAVVNATPVNDSTGYYHYDLVLAAPGKHRMRWYAQGLPGNVPIGSATSEVNAVESTVQ